MKSMIPVYSRIILRYVAGALVSAGYLSPELAATVSVDPDLLMLTGLAVAAVAEAAYTLAKKYKWET